jgi:hypothetical protein
MCNQYLFYKNCSSTVINRLLLKLWKRSQNSVPVFPSWVFSSPHAAVFQLQGVQKVIQPTLKYLLMVVIHYNSTGLIYTQYRCNNTRAHTCHVMLQPARASPSVVWTVEVQGCLLHKCNVCSLSNTNRYLVITELAMMSVGVHFPVLLCQKYRVCLVWWTVSVTWKLFTGLYQITEDGEHFQHLT